MRNRRSKGREEKSIFQDGKAAGAVKLLVNILYRAVRDYVQYVREIDGVLEENDKQRFEYAVDAWEWFLAEEDEEFGSFNSICLVLGLDPKQILGKLARLSKRNILDELDDGGIENSFFVNEKDPEREA